MYFNFILSYLKQIEVPDTEFPGGHIYENIAFVEEVPSNIDIVTVRSQNAVKLSVKDLKIGFKSDDFYYRSGLVKAKGAVDATISQVSMDISISLGSQKLRDGRMVPQVTIPEFKLVLPKDHIDIKIHGNVVVSIVNAFKNFFIKTMTGTITRLVEKEMKNNLPITINQAIVKTNGETELFNGTMLDWSAPKFPVFSQQKLFVPIKGLFFKKGSKKIEPSILVPGMVPDPAEKSLLKFAVSSYSVESILMVNQGYSGWTSHQELPKDSEVRLDTKYLDYYLPGLHAMYGYDFTKVNYEIVEIKKFTMTEAD